jgi:hypothetical protein
MTTLAIGNATSRQAQVATYSLPASIVASVVPVNVAVPVSTPQVTPPVYVTTGNVSISPDNPGMISFLVRRQFEQSQDDALRSATQNTAAAFGLNVTYSGDKAVLFNNLLFLQLINNIPPIDTDITQVLIPP